MNTENYTKTRGQTQMLRKDVMKQYKTRREHYIHYVRTMMQIVAWN
jgi:hypothetical protein